MEPKPQPEPQDPQQEPPAGDVPPKKDPAKAAGSLNPKEKTAFYEAVVQKGKKKRF